MHIEVAISDYSHASYAKTSGWISVKPHLILLVNAKTVGQVKFSFLHILVHSHFSHDQFPQQTLRFPNLLSTPLELLDIFSICNRVALLLLLLLLLLLSS